MRLSQLLGGIPILARRGATDADIAAVHEDSRAVVGGSLFIAVPGEVHDGHKFVAGALQAGAAAVVVERDEGLPLAEGQALIVVESTRRAVGLVGCAWYGHPELTLTLVGVTGTNGKTTITFLVEAILRAAGHRPGVIGTVTNRFEGHSRPASLTTPGALQLAGELAAMRDAGATHVVMEVTSHALVQERVFALRFAAAGFTNLTQDHLDFHGTMEAYFLAKRRLFSERLRENGVGVALTDTEYGQRMLDAAPRAVSCTTRDASALVTTRSRSCDVSGTRAELATPAGPISLRSPLVGDFNFENLLVAVGLAIGLGVSPAAIAEGLRDCQGAPGRLERVPNPRGFDIFVDYAHTPDALERVLQAVRPLVRGRLLCVFGCGGDRDRTKRPKMGAAAVLGADLAIVTSDNPRTEEPSAIVDMVVTGAREAGGIAIDAAELGGASRGYAVSVDRRSAIRLAVAAARPGDVLVIAGKGHEDYQILGKEKVHFDDREEARAALGACA